MNRDQAYFVYSFHGDVSQVQDRAQLVYTSCQYPTEYEEVDIDLGIPQKLMEWGRSSWYERGKYHHEIALSSLDGSNQQRLTHNLRLDHYPAWSPDGERIAFISSPEKRIQNSRDLGVRLNEQQLYTMSAEGSDVQAVAPQLSGIALVAPVWAPNGQHLAVVIYEGGHSFLESREVLYTVRTNDSEVTRIGETASVSVTWSPDGERLAFVGDEGQGLYTAQPDSTDVQRVWSSTACVEQQS